MEAERRCARRSRPEELSYIQFEPEGGGIVLNASEQGLAFHAAAPPRQTGPIQLCVSPNPMQQIELTAEIAWMDETKKSGGLRFTELTSDARNQILQWLTQTSESDTPAKKFVVPTSILREKTAPRAHRGSRTADLISPVPDNAMPTGSDSARLARRSCNVPTRTLLSAPFAQDGHIPISRPRLPHGLATGFLVVVLVLAPVFFSRSLRHEFGNSLIRIGEKLIGDRDSQPDASSSAPAQISNRSSISTPSAPTPIPPTPIPPTPIPGTSPKETLDQSDSSKPTQTTGAIVNSAGSRRPASQNSRQHSAEAHARRGRSPLARQLWSALGAGDSSAEVPLAQLYLTGDGVPRNCAQARVLLEAASKNGNSEALQELRKLKKGACR
jgi:hypothetical protein